MDRGGAVGIGSHQGPLDGVVGGVDADPIAVALGGEVSGVVIGVEGLAAFGVGG